MRLPIIKGHMVNLRPVRRMDIEAIAHLANDAKVAQFLPSLPHPYSIDDARRWINIAQRSARQDRAYHFTIELPATSEFIGAIGIKNLNATDQNGEIGYWLGRKYWQRGYSTEAVSLSLKFAFEELRLWRVYAVVLAANGASARLLERSGFQREGVWRQASRLRGKWWDVYAYGMLREEYVSTTGR
jgi:RimJ/RimL family protein N-acetyltransferase